jgi:hypothetical protein
VLQLADVETPAPKANEVEAGHAHGKVVVTMPAASAR